MTGVARAVDDHDCDVDRRTDRAAEMWAFGGQGLVVRGEVLYGVVP